MFITKSKRPSLIYVECKSREISRKNSRIVEYNQDQVSNWNIKDYKKIKEQQLFLNEQHQMILEDINGKLLQRAELIGQFEELEQLIEHHKKNSQFEFKLAQNIEKLDQLKHSQNLRLSQTTTNLIRDREIQHKELKQKINGDTQIAFKQYLRQWKKQFDNILEQHGQEVYDNFIKEQEQQINQLITLQYNQKIQGIIQLLRNIDKLDKTILINVQIVDEQLIPQIQDIKEQLQEITINKKEDEFLQKRVQLLEIENYQLENKLKDMSQKIDQQEILNKQKTEEIYNEILTGFDCLSQIEDDDSNKKNQPPKSCTSISSITKQIKRPNSSKDESLHFSQLQQYLQLNSVESCIAGDTNSKCSSACQLSADDSLLLHFNELNLSFLQSDKRNNNNINLPLQPFNLKSESPPQEQIRLRTITEEQLSSKREKSKIDQTKLYQQQQQQQFNNHNKIFNFQKVKLIEKDIYPLTDQTKRFSNTQQNYISIPDNNETTQKQISIQSPYMPLFFNQPNNPQTQKNQQPQYFKFKDIGYSTNSTKTPLLSEQIQKHKKSKSFDSTRSKDIQQRKLFCNVSSINNNVNSQEFIEQKESQLIPIEQQILKIMKPLQKGIQIYKKFATAKPNMTKQEFDPFTNQNPLSCGYGTRIIALSHNLNKIEFRNSVRINQVDSIIPIDQILRVFIPKSIQQSILIKKQITNKYILSQEERIVNNISFWPLSIVTQTDGRFELLFEDENTLEQWCTGLAFLKDNAKTLNNINKKLLKS